MKQNQGKASARILRKSRETRLMLASRFRVLCADCGLTIDEVAKLLRVTPRTVRYWFSGQSAVPYAAYKLVRVLRWFELPGDGFAGWSMHSGRLWTPEGHPIAPEDGGWWSLLVRQARAFRVLVQRSHEFERTLLLATEDGRAALGLPRVPVGTDGPPAGRPADRRRTGRAVPPADGGRAAKPPGGLDLSIGHKSTEEMTPAARERTLTRGVTA
jgi:transcriptional regulator with XRE-family HTH domain